MRVAEAKGGGGSWVIEFAPEHHIGGIEVAEQSTGCERASACETEEMGNTCCGKQGDTDDEAPTASTNNPMNSAEFSQARIASIPALLKANPDNICLNTFDQAYFDSLDDEMQDEHTRFVLLRGGAAYQPLAASDFQNWRARPSTTHP